VEHTLMPMSSAADGPELRPVDIMTTELWYRVRGPLALDAAENAESGTVFVRTSFDHLSRAYLEVSDVGYVVRFEAFKRAWWQWSEEADVRRAFAAGEGALAGRYFNSLALSPGYRGPVSIELERERA
jgi:hypothetical protein